MQGQEHQVIGLPGPSERLPATGSHACCSVLRFGFSLVPWGQLFLSCQIRGSSPSCLGSQGRGCGCPGLWWCPLPEQSDTCCPEPFWIRLGVQGSDWQFLGMDCSRSYRYWHSPCLWRAWGILVSPPLGLFLVFNIFSSSLWDGLSGPFICPAFFFFLN